MDIYCGIIYTLYTHWRFYSVFPLANVVRARLECFVLCSWFTLTVLYRNIYESAPAERITRRRKQKLSVVGNRSTAVRLGTLIDFGVCRFDGGSFNVPSHTDFIAVTGTAAVVEDKVRGSC